MDDEYNALLSNNAWSLIPYTNDIKLVDNKWIFQVKYNPNGFIQRYKAQLIAKSFQQIAGLDYFDTFSLVIKWSTIRVVPTIVVTKGWDIQQIDISNAFLNGDL